MLGQRFLRPILVPALLLPLVMPASPRSIASARGAAGAQAAQPAVIDEWSTRVSALDALARGHAPYAGSPAMTRRASVEAAPVGHGWNSAGGGGLSDGVVEYCQGPAGPADGDTISNWSVRTSQHGAAASSHPLRVVVVLAMVHLAMYDAVNAIAGGYQPYASQPVASPGASPTAAAIRAAYVVLKNEYPTREPQLTSDYDSDMAALSDSEQAKADGIAVGDAAANAIIALRANDGRNANVSYTPRSGPGFWQPTPPAFLPAALPALALMTPFTMDSPSQFRAPGPPALSSQEWAAEYNEVKAIGCDNCRERTADQTAIALFWSAPSNVILPPSIRDTSALHGLDLAEAARMQAMAFTAQADGIISSWDSKYSFNFWRPVTAIRAGDTDGNDATAPDTSWTPLLVTPNHPEYTAAHAHISSAVISAMSAFFGQEKFDFVVRNPNTNISRCYMHAIQAELEVSNARVWSGIHYRVSCVHGRNAGRAIARNLAGRFFRKVR